MGEPRRNPALRQTSSIPVHNHDAGARYQALHQRGQGQREDHRRAAVAIGTAFAAVGVDRKSDVVADKASSECGSPSMSNACSGKIVAPPVSTNRASSSPATQFRVSASTSDRRSRRGANAGWRSSARDARHSRARACWPLPRTRLRARWASRRARSCPCSRSSPARSPPQACL